MKKIIIDRIKSLCILMLLMLTGNAIYAERINEQQAKTVAENFLKSETGKTMLKTVLHYKRVENDGTVDYYIFNVLGGKGFVIVTGDDNLKPIIAYSTESGFDINIAEKNGVNFWMDKMGKQIPAALKQNVRADKKIAGLWQSYLSGTAVMNKVTSSIGPLLTTTWDQGGTSGSYYNSLCPRNSSGDYCPTGCTATAMAQIMKYWNYPAHGIGSHSYTDNNYGTQSANFGATTYNWSLMNDVVGAGCTNDVDILMYHCGVSVESDYEISGTAGCMYWGAFCPGAGSAKQAYVDYFGYDAAIDGKTKAVYLVTHSKADWISMLEDELDLRHPIQYCGGSANNAHTWVVDGYDSNDNFHMNWGWGGYLNGYFDLDNLTPGGDDFNSYEGALIGIRPDGLSSCEPDWTLSATQNYDYTWQASNHVVSSAGISPDVTSIYTAQNMIILSPGFHTTSNVKFTAKIKSCITPRLISNSSSETVAKLNEQNLSVYPNPFTGKITVQFNLNSDDEVTIKMFDVIGKEVMTVSKSIYEAGTHEVQADASVVKPGVYFVIVQTKDFRKEQKVIKVN